MKRRVVLSLVTAGLITMTLDGQCLRCGPTGGGGQSQGYVATSTYRSPSLTALANGNGKVSVTFVSRSEAVDDTTVISSLLLEVDWVGVTNATTVTGADIRVGVTGTSPGALVLDLTPYLAGTPILLTPGSGKIVRQGPQFDLTAYASTLSRYTLRLQFDKSADWLALGTVIPVQTELVVLAPLTPKTPNAAGLTLANSAGTGALTASIARDSNGAISSAEIRFGLNVAKGSSITKADVHAGDASGAVVLDSGLTKAVNAATGTLALVPLQIDAVNNPAEVQVLENLLKDPTAYYFDFHSDGNPGVELGGTLQRTEDFVVVLNDDPSFTGAEPGLADGRINVSVLRDASGYRAGLATFDFLYRGFNSGAVIAGLSSWDGNTPLTGDDVAFDGTANDLIVRDGGIGGLILRAPLLGNSATLATLVKNNPPTFGTILNSSLGAVVSLHVNVEEQLANQPRISSITPAISTPGSLVTIAGDSFSDAPKVFIGGALATIIGKSEATKIVARVPSSLSVNLNAPVFVVDQTGRVSNNLTVGLDIAEPLVLGLVDSTSKQAVSEGAPLAAGGTLEIQCTGLSADPGDATKLSSYLGVSVKVDGVVLTTKTTVVADAVNLGRWKVTVQLPAGTVAAGKHALVVLATVKLPSDTSVYSFPSAAVDLYTK